MLPRRRYPLHLLVVLAGLIAACEDKAPTDYIPRNVVEGFLIVDEPIRGILVMRSQPIDEAFRLERSAVPAADVSIIAGDRVLPLAYRAGSGAGEFYYPDTTERVQPETDYRIEVRMPDGAVITGATRTPARIDWVKRPQDMQYPKDTLKLPAPDSLSLDWTSAPGVNEYIVSVRCLDTVGYGAYLIPPTDERNRRIERFFEREFRDYSDMARIVMIQGSSTPVSWFVFKWFGRHEVTVFAGDQAFIRWYKMLYFQQQPNYQETLGSVQGGLGVFASASAIRQRIFLYKNQP